MVDPVHNDSGSQKYRMCQTSISLDLDKSQGCQNGRIYIQIYVRQIVCCQKLVSAFLKNTRNTECIVGCSEMGSSQH